MSLQEHEQQHDAGRVGLSFTAFLEAMKDPKASDLVRSIKLFIRSFEEQQKKRKNMGNLSSEALEEDGARVQDFVETMEQAMYGHVVWKDAPDTLVPDAVEGLEKYIMSKVWGSTFGIAEEDKDKDERYKRLCDALEFLDLKTVIGDGVVLNETTIQGLDLCLDAAQEHIRKMDRYKAPRDKLLCLINVQKILEDGIESVHSSSFGGADAFFPLMILAVIRAKPPSLCSNIEYIRRFRGRRLSGKFDFMLSYLESAAMYLDTVDWKDLRISQDEFLARLTKAGIPEAELLNAEKNILNKNETIVDKYGKRETRDDVLVHLIDGSTTALHDTMASSGNGALSPVQDEKSITSDAVKEHDTIGHNIGQVSVEAKDTFNSIQSLIEEGTPLVLHEESEGLLQQKFPWIYANAGDLRVGEVAQLLSDYRELVLQHEALKLALREHLPVISPGTQHDPNPEKTQPLLASRMSSVSDAAGSLMQKLSIYGWKKDYSHQKDVTEHASSSSQQQPRLLHSLFGRPQAPANLDVSLPSTATPTSGLSPIVGVENTPTLNHRAREGDIHAADPLEETLLGTDQAVLEPEKQDPPESLL